VIEPHDPKSGNGHPPVGLERMLQVYFVQHGFNLADAACEDGLLEKHTLGEALFAKVGQVFQAHGLKVGTGSIVDATLIGAPSSTKKADAQRQPCMRRSPRAI
jgi:IS5 family transposase